MARRVRGHGGNPPGQGPFMEVELSIEGERILEASYETYQCPACHDCGKAVCELVKGRGLAETAAIDWPALSNRVGPLPRAKRICLGLALLALSDALGKLDRKPGPDEVKTVDAVRGSTLGE